MSQIREFEGTITQVNDRPSKDFYGIEINGEEWHYGENSLKAAKLGDKVKLAVDESKEHDILAIKMIQGRSSSQDEKLSSKPDGGAGPSNTSRDMQIRKSLAFKKAVDQVDRRDVEDDDQYKELVKNFMKIHMEILEEELE